MEPIKLKPEELEGFIGSIHWQLFRQSNNKIAVHLLLNGKNLKKCLEYATCTNKQRMFSQCLDIAEYKTRPYFVNRRGIK